MELFGSRMHLEGSEDMCRADRHRVSEAVAAYMITRSMHSIGKEIQPALAGHDYYHGFRSPQEANIQSRPQQ